MNDLTLTDNLDQAISYYFSILAEQCGIEIFLFVGFELKWLLVIQYWLSQDINDIPLWASTSHIHVKFLQRWTEAMQHITFLPSFLENLDWTLKVLQDLSLCGLCSWSLLWTVGELLRWPGGKSKHCRQVALTNTICRGLRAELGKRGELKVSRKFFLNHNKI